MFRRRLYYALTFLLGGSSVAGVLNSQFIIVGARPSGAGMIPWEVALPGWGSLLYVLGCLFLAPLSDRLGRQPCIALSALLIGVLNLALALIPGDSLRIGYLFMYLGLANLGFAVFFTSVEGLLSEYQDLHRTLARRLGAYCMAWCLGDILFYFLTGFAKDSLGSRAVFAGAAGFCLIASAAASWDWRRGGGGQKLGDTPIDAASISPEAPFHALLGRMGIFFTCIAYSAIAGAFPRFGRDFHALGEGPIGALFANILLFGFAAFVALSFWRGWQYNLTLQWLLQLPLAIGLAIELAAPRGHLPLILAGLAFFGIGYGTSYFFSIYYSLTAPADHAKSGGIHEAIIGMGNMLGPWAAMGIIWASARREWVSAGRSGAFAIALGLAAAILSLVIQLVLIRRRRKLRESSSRQSLRQSSA